MDTDQTDHTSHSGVRLLIYWTVVSLPLLWGIWKTAVKLPTLFQ